MIYIIGKWVGFLMVLGAVFIASWASAADPSSVPMRTFTRYCLFLERKLRLMFVWTPGAHIALGQFAAVALLALLMVAGLDLPAWAVALLAIAVVAGPPFYIERMRQQRVEKIEEQLNGFLQALANALKATPSISNAFTSVQALLPIPFRQEVELANKEMRVGATLDQALLNMAGRIGSKQVDSALSAVLIGRQLGGDLPRILESSANTLREMSRLEGVVKSKTAEGKAQLWVLAFFPFVMVWALQGLMPGYFATLTGTILGWLVAIGASLFWIASLVIARKILAVDI